jgi:hypothetical protein
MLFVNMWVAMAKLIKSAPKVRKGETLKLKRVRDPETGQIIVIRTVNADSETFDSDLSHAFRSNVSAALRNSKK